MTSCRQIILTFDGGGLCNRIFPFANAIAASWDHDCQLVNPVFGAYRSYFRGPGNDFQVPNEPLDKLKLPSFDLPLWRARFRIARRLKSKSVVQGGESIPINLDQLIAATKSTSRIWVDALYCLANKSLVRHASKLRAYFRPVEQIEQAVAACLKQARDGIDVLIGVHIRQGDYMQHDNGMLFYETTEYVQLMRTVQQLFPTQRVRFLVCSNVAQSEDDLRGFDWCFGPGTEIGDLYSLAACDFIVGAPSSYTQWASFYGEVPRLVHNRKYEEQSGGHRTRVDIDSFVTHQCGFGRFESNSCTEPRA